LKKDLVLKPVAIYHQMELLTANFLYATLIDIEAYVFDEFIKCTLANLNAYSGLTKSARAVCLSYNNQITFPTLCRHANEADGHKAERYFG
jgi:hypothetical protein